MIDRYDLTHKVVIITGGNSGIGKAAATLLAKSGATVILACRSLQRGVQALAEVREDSGSAQVALIQIDLASQSSIRQFAAAFREKFDRLDVLIHNAANFDHRLKQPALTGEGIETVFATNHLGPFLLTHLLLDLLKASAPSRVITVASKGLISYPRLEVDFGNLNGERKFSMQHAYYQSKQAQVMFTFDLAERLKASGVTVNCIRVGNVAIPDQRLDHLPRWMVSLYHLKRRFAMTPEKMAETYLWLAADPALQAVTSGYFDAPGVPARANPYAYNPQKWKRLWEVSAWLTGIG